MAKTIDDAISELTTQVTSKEAELRKMKESVNTLCAVDGRQPIYLIESAEASVPTAIRSDQFYGQPLASAVRTILEMRNQRNRGAASINEIYDALNAGGFQFNTKSDLVSKNSLRNSLAKNTIAFHKLPNGHFGLLSWYPKVQKSASEEAEEEEAEETDTPETATTPEPSLRRR
jgi:hypothetical protein